jgi:hypothetical protein
MTGYEVMCFIAAGVFTLLAFVPQRWLWWKTIAWQYRNPRANEPSDTSLAIGAFGMLFMAALCFGLGWTLHSAAQDEREQAKASYKKSPRPTRPPDPAKARIYSPSEVREKAQAVANEARDENEVDLGAIIVEVSDGNLQSKIKGDRMTGVTETDYELTNRKGEHPVCLTVTTGLVNRLVSTATVRDGRCPSETSTPNPKENSNPPG